MSDSTTDVNPKSSASNVQAKEETSQKRPADAMDNDTTSQPSAKEIELLRLEKAYQAAQLERRTLLRQIQEMLDEQSNTSNAGIIINTIQSSEATATTRERQILASTHAHSSPIPPMTSTEEAATGTAAQSVIKEHIKLLSQYNEIRDIGQGLIGMVAENRKVRIRDCQEEFGVADGD